MSMADPNISPPGNTESTGLRPPELLRCNQYLTAEQVPPELLTRFYDSYELYRRKPSTSGWFHIEMGMHAPQHLQQAAVDLHTARQKACEQGDVTFYGDSVFGLAYLPIFTARSEGRQPTKDALDTLETDLTNLLHDDRLEIGERTTTAVLLLGVRRAARTGDTSWVLYPSSPREGRNHIRNSSKKNCNHDCYVLDPDMRKRPVEVKLHSGGGYAPDVFEFRLAARIADVIRDHGLFPDDVTVQSMLYSPKPHSSELLKLATDALTGVGSDDSTRRRLLSALEHRFWDLLNQHRKANPVPGQEFPRPGPCANRPAPDAREAPGQPGSPERVIAGANGSSVVNMAEAVIALLQNLPTAELQAASDRLATAQTLLQDTAGGTAAIGEISNSLNVPLEKLYTTLAALALSRSRLADYLQQIGVPYELSDNS